MKMDTKNGGGEGKREPGDDEGRGVWVYEAWRPSQLCLAVSRRLDKDLLGQTVG